MHVTGRRNALLGLAALLTIPGFARAHHGFGGRYDTSKPIYLSGAVVSSRWGMPHPVLQLRVASVDAPPRDLPQSEEFANRLVVRREDANQTRTVEFPPVRVFLELEDQIKAGQSLSIIALRNCDAPHQLRGQWMMLPGGRVVVRTGRVQTEVAGCPA
ncbi:MAG: DUF6152 family protein [Burkholderiaceae bacterium]